MRRHLPDICRFSEEIGIRHRLGDDTLTGVREPAKLNVPPSLYLLPFPYRDVTNEQLERLILVRSLQSPQVCRERIANRSGILARFLYDPSGNQVTDSWSSENAISACLKR